MLEDRAINIIQKGLDIMKFYEPIELRDIIKIIKEHMDKGVSYCVYSELLDSDDLTLGTICYIGKYPEVTDDDEEIFPDFVEKNSLNLIFREELLQDVVNNVFHQKASATDEEILKAISYYSKNDSFMSFNL